MTERSHIQDWQHVARDIAAWDLATDRHDDDREFTDWADLQFGDQARQFIATHDSLMNYRFGPETTPPPDQRTADQLQINAGSRLLRFDPCQGGEEPFEVQQRVCNPWANARHEHLNAAASTSQSAAGAGDLEPETSEQFAANSRPSLWTQSWRRTWMCGTSRS